MIETRQPPRISSGVAQHVRPSNGRRLAMGIALTLQQFLDDKHVDYDVLTHKRTHSSASTARASHVPNECLAKAVVLTREGGFVIAVVPASGKVNLDAIERMLHCPVGMASEEEIEELFPDCAMGAVPAIAEAYAVDAFVDSSLEAQPDVYLEGGDHRSLIHITGDQFRDLMKDVRHAPIAMLT
jgi:Ala-tRNA(Pro) deacylase